METSMTPSRAPINNSLAEKVLSFNLSEDLIRQRVHQIQRNVLTHSPYLRHADFTRIHTRDLEFLFGAYDERFFDGLCRQSLAGRKLSFRLSPRMTKSGGKTSCFTTHSGEVSYQISIAISMLFDGFAKTDRRVRVCGLDCENRLEAVQRIFEHEMVHLTELLCWGNSECAAQRFQGIAARLFLHRGHTHDLVTRRERAADLGIRVGALVKFTCEGRELTGRVNRITKRATVLVEDPDGAEYSDGRRYTTYYVPLAWLKAQSVI
jgi:hypothetical protein